MTLAEFFNELRRLHCIDGWCVPELGEDVERFIAAPVYFFIHCTDAQRETIWRAMREDAERWTRPAGTVIDLTEALRRTLNDVHDD